MADTILAPFDMLTPDNCCALLVDHQPGLYYTAGDISVAELKSNSIAVAKVLELHNIPTVITCAAQGPRGPLGPLLPEIAEHFPGVEPIYRTKINSWMDDDIRAAIQATGRRKVITAGITADFCAGLPSKSMVDEGYDVRLIIDASGNTSPMVLQAAIANLTQHGVKIMGWVALAMELLGDWAREEQARGSLEIYNDHLSTWGFLETIQAGWRGSLATT